MIRHEFQILGPLEVTSSDGPIDVGGPRQRALLALLLLNANRALSRERIVDALWGEEPPATARNALQVAIHGLRRALGSARRLWTESLELTQGLSNVELAAAGTSLMIAVSALEGHEASEALPRIVESLRAYDDLEFKDLASSLVAFARAVLHTDGRLSARALGAAGAIRAQLWPAAFSFEPGWHERTLEEARALLGTEKAAEEVAEGARAPTRTVAEILAQY